MPHELQLDGPLTQEMMKRISQEPEQKEFDLGLKPTVRPDTLSPDLAMILGSLADGATTYNFLNKGRASESNSMYAGLNNDPIKTGLAVVGTGLAQTLLMKLLKNKFPKLAPLADAKTANSAANRINAAVEGIQLNSKYVPNSAINDYKSKITTEIGNGPKIIR